MTDQIDRCSTPRPVVDERTAIACGQACDDLGRLFVATWLACRWDALEFQRKILALGSNQE